MARGLVKTRWRSRGVASFTLNWMVRKARIEDIEN
jgi:hypothetical protein